jgi:hypothetical protein
MRKHKTDTRNFKRIPYIKPAYIKMHNTLIKGETVDISLKGIKIKIKDKILIRTGDLIDIRIEIQENDFLEFRGLVKNVIMKTNEKFIGIFLTKISSDNFNKLHSILIENKVDNDEIYKELKKFIEKSL